MIGHPAPLWQVTTLDGEPAPALASLRGQPVLLLFFSLGCPGCTGRALPFSGELAAQYPDLHLVGIHTMAESQAAYTSRQIRGVADYYHLTYPIYQDDGAATYRRFEAAGTPHWVLLNTDGTVRKHVFGSMDGARLNLTYALDELFSPTS